MTDLPVQRLDSVIRRLTKLEVDVRAITAALEALASDIKNAGTQ